MFKVEKFELLQIIEKRANEICLLLMSIYIAFSIFYIFFGVMNNDEGWYLYASKLVYDGKIPYIDFSYTQPPLFPYIYGIPQHLFGPSLYVGRLTSLFFGVFTLMVTMKVAEKFGGKIGAIIALSLISFNPGVIYGLTVVKTYSLTAFLMVLSFYFLFCFPKIKNPAKSMLSILCMSLALGVRLSVLPAVFLLLLYILYTERKNIETIILSIATGFIACGFLFIPFLVRNKDILIFNLVGYHIGRAEAMSMFDILFNILNIIFSSVNSFFAILVLIFAGSLNLYFHKQNYYSKYHEILLFYAVILSVSIVHLMQKPTFSGYSVIIVPIASIISAYIFSQIYINIKDNFVKINFVYIVIFMILLTPLAQFAQGHVGVDRSVIGGIRPIQNIEEMSNYIKNHTPENGKLLVFSTYAAVQANRDVLPGFEMSLFSYYPDWSDDKTKKYNVVNRHLLNEYIESKNASAILLTSSEIGSLKIGNDTMHLIEENYYLAKSIQRWGQWDDTANLYLPKESQK